VQAIILKKHQFAETNEVITFFSRESGKSRVVAKASKSAKSKLAFGLQPLFLVELDLVSGKNMPTVTGVKVLRTYSGIRESSSKIAAALSACEFILKATADEHPNGDLFDLLNNYLGYLSERAPQTETSIIETTVQNQTTNKNQTTSKSHITNKSLWKFIFLALGTLGFAAQMRDCVICHKLIPSQNNSHFSFRLGGLICDSCASRAAADAVRISAATRDFFTQSQTQISQNQNAPTQNQTQTNIFEEAENHPAAENEVRAIAENYSSYILERELKAPSFL
jgi:recombinational DNA repair protein (RecF pathway)